MVKWTTSPHDSDDASGRRHGGGGRTLDYGVTAPRMAVTAEGCTAERAFGGGVRRQDGVAATLSCGAAVAAVCAAERAWRRIQVIRCISRCCY